MGLDPVGTLRLLELKLTWNLTTTHFARLHNLQPLCCHPGCRKAQIPKKCGEVLGLVEIVMRLYLYG